MYWYSASVSSAPVYRTENFNTCFCLFRNCEKHGPMNRGSCVGGRIFVMLWICRYSLKISFTFIGHLTDRLSGWLEKEGNLSLELYGITVRSSWFRTGFTKYTVNMHLPSLLLDRHIAVNWSACIKDHGNLYQKKNLMGPRPNTLVLEWGLSILKHIMSLDFCYIFMYYLLIHIVIKLSWLRIIILRRTLSG